MRTKLRIYFSDRTREILCTLAITLVTVFLSFFRVPFLEYLEYKAWDLHFEYRGTLEPSGAVAFVTIDEASVDRDGRWPWPRRLTARLIKEVEAHGAQVIGLDMGWFEPDPKIRKSAILDLRNRLGQDSGATFSTAFLNRLQRVAEEEDDDLILVETLKSISVPVVLGYFFYFKEDSATSKATAASIPRPSADEMPQNARFPVVKITGEPYPGALFQAVGAEINIPVVSQATPAAGYYNAFNDLDGAIRSIPLVVRYQDNYYPSLALQMLAAGFQAPLILDLDGAGVREIRLGPFAIPTDQKGRFFLNYYGPGYTFPHFSATDLLHHQAPPDCLKNRMVVIGNTTMGLHDMRPTVFDPVFPGVELHCLAIDNILQQKTVRRPTDAVLYDLTALIVLAILFVGFQLTLRGMAFNGAVLALIGGYVALNHYYFFLQRGLWLNTVYPCFNLAALWLVVSAIRYIREEREKRKFRDTFSLYLAPAVIKEVMDNPEKLRLGGEKKELTVLFSDIRGFTTLSEQLSPEALVPQLNHYLTRMTEVIFNHLGTTDKFIGDAIMAFFGAPQDQPDHAARACETALDMLKTLGRLQQEWKRQGLPALTAGIGINTGVMMVGNMGSERLFDYTVIGDNVNLASRLEGVTKMYGVPLVVSESTWNATGERFVGRILDLVRVKGRQHPVGIYQVLDGIEHKGTFEASLKTYHEGVEAYRAGQWSKALELFVELKKTWPHDVPTAMYEERCRNLLLQLQQGEVRVEEWDYVTKLEVK